MKKAFFWLFLPSILIVIILVIYYLQAVNAPNSVNSGTVKFSIAKGQGVEEIARGLQAGGLVKSGLIFKLYALENGWQNRFIEGDYELANNLNTKEIVKILVTGQQMVSKEKTILIKEGKSIKEIAQIMQDNGLFLKEEFLASAGYPMVDYRQQSGYPALADYSPKYGFLKDKPAYVGLEGYLFPDTYRFFKDTTAEGVIIKMLANFDKKLIPELRTKIKAKDKTIYEIVTMASLIEKEVQSAEDMKLVSGIFWKRIQNGQRLESCATLAYILGVNKSQYTIDDTQIDSPYNTYRNQGLPPGPISNPGLKAIEAAISPQESDYNYFLTADLPEGKKTIFARTFNEHVSNKAKYLK